MTNHHEASDHQEKEGCSIWSLFGLARSNGNLDRWQFKKPRVRVEIVGLQKNSGIS